MASQSLDPVPELHGPGSSIASHLAPAQRSPPQARRPQCTRFPGPQCVTTYNFVVSQCTLMSESLQAFTLQAKCLSSCKMSSLLTAQMIHFFCHSCIASDHWITAQIWHFKYWKHVTILTIVFFYFLRIQTSDRFQDGVLYLHDTIYKQYIIIRLFMNAHVNAQ